MARGSKVGTHSKARSCDGKRQYESRTAAEDAIWKLRRKKLSVMRMLAYQCKYCGKFHIGHKKFGKR